MKTVAICPPASEEWGVCLIGHPEEVGLTLLRILFSTLSWVSELLSNYKWGVRYFILLIQPTHVQ